MANQELVHLHQDIETMKRDIAVIKHILSDEGSLTDEARQRLESARKTPLSSYEKL